MATLGRTEESTWFSGNLVAILARPFQVIISTKSPVASATAATDAPAATRSCSSEVHAGLFAAFYHGQEGSQLSCWFVTIVVVIVSSPTCVTTTAEATAAAIE
jgi:hypothetical protein